MNRIVRKGTQPKLDWIYGSIQLKMYDGEFVQKTVLIYWVTPLRLRFLYHRHTWVNRFHHRTAQLLADACEQRPKARVWTLVLLLVQFFECLLIQRMLYHPSKDHCLLRTWSQERLDLWIKY